MKALSPLLSPRSLERDLGVWRGKSGAEELLLCNMNDCYRRLKELVPSLPHNRSVSKMEILQHVIDYILDLQTALDSSSSSSTNTTSAAPPEQEQEQEEEDGVEPERAVISLHTFHHTTYFQTSNCPREMTSDDHMTIPR
ncbi:DNA-binding protein inhibitor ID-2b [Hoplias malabaricus]|uniref:DNA-binding protein inhibitor ID-2b n=1 Tax=Hoplias malabaricus TaxID=27720 RepID=UPI00346335ED